MRKSFLDFKELFEIEINKDFINQVFQTNIKGESFEIEIRTLNEKIILEIKINNIIIVPFHTLKTEFPLNITTFYKFNRGYFFVTGNKNGEIDLKSYKEMRLFYGIF